MGINKRIVESIDIFPTLIELASLPTLPQCEGIDQPPTTACLQGESYASEFVTGPSTAAVAALGSGGGTPPKTYAFSQWPFPKWGNETGLRQVKGERSDFSSV